MRSSAAAVPIGLNRFSLGELTAITGLAIGVTLGLLTKAVSC
jgi:hypothetical protein